MKIKRFLLITLVAVSAMSCSILKSVSFVPSFNAAIVNDVVLLGKKVDSMYIKMEQSKDKVFSTYANDYLGSEVLINSIIVRDQARPKSEIIVRQAVLYRDMFLAAKEYHKKNIKLNDSEIRSYKQYHQAQLKPLLVSEMALK